MRKLFIAFVYLLLISCTNPSSPESDNNSTILISGYNDIEYTFNKFEYEIVPTDKGNGIIIYSKKENDRFEISIFSIDSLNIGTKIPLNKPASLLLESNISKYNISISNINDVGNSGFIEIKSFDIENNSIELIFSENAKLTFSDITNIANPLLGLINVSGEINPIKR